MHKKDAFFKASFFVPFLNQIDKSLAEKRQKADAKQNGERYKHRFKFEGKKFHTVLY